MIQKTANELKKGEKATIKSVDMERLPLKLFELGCLPGNPIELLQRAVFNDPIYMNINGSYIAIRVEIAQHIEVQIG